jgi:hypothetical protein
MTKMIDFALEYFLKHDFSIIPIKGKAYAQGETEIEKEDDSKRSLVKWQEFQSRKATQDEIKKWWKKWPNANIGIVTGVINNLAVIDIDTDEGKEAILDYIPESILTPTVETPKGQHLYFRCPDDELRGNVRKIQGCDLRANGNYAVAPPSFGFNGKQYKWIIDLKTSIAPIPDAYLKHIYNSIYSYKQNVTDSVTLFQDGRRDEDLFHVANQLAKAKTPENEIRQVIEILGRNCTPPFPEKEIDIKIESALKRIQKKEINIAETVERWVSVTDGDFSVTDAVQAVQSVTGVTNRDTVRQALKRLKDARKITKSGSKDGVYRRVDDHAEDIDWLSADDETIDFRYPLEIEKYVLTLPKNIIVIAGVPNSGKTAFLLNCVRLNMKIFDIHYFSSEMGSHEFKSRLSKFDLPLNNWKFHAKERVSDFASVIKPNAINIIDYLEMTEDFWLVAKYLKEIYERLSKGIALVAIQKNPGTDVGLGGYRGMEKPRLYINLEAGKAKIVKAKNWANPETNPNGLELQFKLIHGCKFAIEKDWGK